MIKSYTLIQMLSATCLTLLMCSGVAVAQYSVKKELTIVDINGIPRATAEVEEGAHIMFILKDPKNRLADRVNVTLTPANKDNNGGPEILETDEGRAVFCEVPAGVWQVTSDVDWALFSDIKIDPIDDIEEFTADCGGVSDWVKYGSGVSAGSLLAVTAVGGATTAAVVGYNRSQADDDDDGPDFPLSPSR